MEIKNTGDSTFRPSVVMVIYGEGGVGKTTFAASAPKAVIADCENGAKYFGLRGIKVDVAQIKSWKDMNFADGFGSIAKGDKYDTIVIDPIGELMEKLKASMVTKGDRKLIQPDGSPSMAGWGWMKDTMKNFLKVLRDSGKHVILVAHVEEKGDEDRLVKRPLIQTKISNDIISMVDIVGYMTVVQKDGESKRVIYVDPTNDKIVCKDRTGQLGQYVEPDFTKIIAACNGTKSYKWSNPSKNQKEQKEIEIPVINDDDDEITPKKKKAVTKSKLAKANAK